MTWVLIASDGSLIASGSWQAVIEAGEEDGVIGRRFREDDGFETSPVLRRGYVMAPAAMFSETHEMVRYG